MYVTNPETGAAVAVRDRPDLRAEIAALLDDEAITWGFSALREYDAYEADPDRLIRAVVSAALAQASPTTKSALRELLQSL